MRDIAPTIAIVLLVLGVTPILYWWPRTQDVLKERNWFDQFRE